MAAKLTMSVSDWLLILVLSVFWGGSFFFAGIAIKEIPPVTLALGRVGIAAAILLVYLRLIGSKLPHFGPVWGPLVVMALLNNVVPFILIFWSQTHIPSGLASILNATTPLFTIVVAHFATTDDKITPPRLAGLIFGFIGVLIVIGPDALRDLGVNVLAQLASLLGAVCYAVSGVYGRRFGNLTPAVVSASILLISTVVIAPLALIADRPWTLPVPSAPAIAATIGVAAISTAAAFLIYFRVLARAGATNLLLVTFLIPVSAILLGALFLGETLAVRHFAGMGAIALGLAAIDGRPQRALMKVWRS
jgi:drug/metabolite transporter (DMT)-like permease